MTNVFKEILNDSQMDSEELRRIVDSVSLSVFDNLKLVMYLAHKKWPGIFNSFYWTQYTPYFNDGEPCEFRVGELGLRPCLNIEALAPSNNRSFYGKSLYERKNDYLNFIDSVKEYYPVRVQPSIHWPSEVEHAIHNLPDEHEIKIAWESIEKIFKMIPESFLIFKFGNDNLVTVTFNGEEINVSTGEFDHE